MTSPHCGAHEGLFTRHGHLTMLSLDRFDAGELAVDACDAVIEHLRGCSTCSTRLHEVQADAPPLRPPEPARIAGRIEPERYRSVAVAVASTLAAAALLLLAGWPRPEHASRISGDSELTASAYTSTTAALDAFDDVGMQMRVSVSGQPLRSHDYVPADALVDLEIETASPGYVAVFALTDNEDDGEGTGGPIDAAMEMVLPVSSIARDRASVQLQSQPLSYGVTESQRIVAVYCPDVFAVEASDGGYQLLTEQSCETVEFELLWTAEAADS